MNRATCRWLLAPLLVASGLAPALSLTGCGTICCLVPLEAGRFGIPKKGKVVLDPYGGVRRDLKVLPDFWPVAIDLPLSFALDTLILPVTGLAWFFDRDVAPPTEPMSPRPAPPRAEPPRLVVGALHEARFEGPSSRTFTAALVGSYRYVVEVRAAPGALDRLWLGRGSGATWVRGTAGGTDLLQAVVEPYGSELTLEVWPTAAGDERFTVLLRR